MRVLVTGALGLVGRATVAELVARGVDVVASDLDTPAARRTACYARPAVARKVSVDGTQHLGARPGWSTAAWRRSPSTTSSGWCRAQAGA